MAWLYLVGAGVLEIGWPIGLKLGWTENGARPLFLGFAIFCIIASGALLMLAQRTIPMGTAYAVWTGIGAAGTFIVGVALYGDPASLMRLLGVAMIVGGVVTLKLAS